MAFNKTEKSDSPMRKKGGMRRRKKVCVFCGKDNVIDYKDTAKLKRYVSVRFFPEELQVTVQNIRELLQQLSNVLATLH